MDAPRGLTRRRRRRTTRARSRDATTLRATATAIVDAHVARGALTTDDARTLRETIALGQEHSVADWPAPGVDDERKRAFVEQVSGRIAGTRGGWRSTCRTRASC